MNWERPQKESTLLTLGSQISSLPKLGDNMLPLFKPSVYSTWFWQPKQTNTISFSAPIPVRQGVWLSHREGTQNSGVKYLAQHHPRFQAAMSGLGLSLVCPSSLCLQFSRPRWTAPQLIQFWTSGALSRPCLSLCCPVGSETSGTVLLPCCPWPALFLPRVPVSQSFLVVGTHAPGWDDHLGWFLSQKDSEAILTLVLKIKQ